MRQASSRARSSPTRKNLVGFVVGGAHYAIDIWRVREVVQPLPLTTLPFAHESIVGVADHRGEVVPVVDLRRQFQEPAEASRKTKWILLRGSDRVLGIVVDAVTGPFGASEDQMRAAPALGGGDARRGISAVTTHHGQMVFVLDPGFIDDIVQPALEQGLPAAGSMHVLEPPR
jgi:purine-binding chemotaxis protein CheW